MKKVTDSRGFGNSPEKISFFWPCSHAPHPREMHNLACLIGYPPDRLPEHNLRWNFIGNRNNLKEARQVIKNGPRKRKEGKKKKQ
jgi:hypothetical protein